MLREDSARVRVAAILSMLFTDGFAPAKSTQCVRTSTYTGKKPVHLSTADATVCQHVLNVTNLTCVSVIMTYNYAEGFMNTASRLT